MYVLCQLVGVYLCLCEPDKLWVCLFLSVHIYCMCICLCMYTSYATCGFVCMYVSQVSEPEHLPGLAWSTPERVATVTNSRLSAMHLDSPYQHDLSYFTSRPSLYRLPLSHSSMTHALDNIPKKTTRNPDFSWLHIIPNCGKTARVPTMHLGGCWVKGVRQHGRGAKLAMFNTSAAHDLSGFNHYKLSRFGVLGRGKKEKEIYIKRWRNVPSGELTVCSPAYPVIMTLCRLLSSCIAGCKVAPSAII